MNVQPQPYPNFVTLADRLISRASVDGGVTCYRGTGRVFDKVGVYLVGGALGIPALKLNSTIVADYDAGVQALARWLNALPVNVELVGSWFNDDDNTFYFDAVAAFDNAEDAADAAEQANQIAVARTTTDGVDVINTPDLRQQANDEFAALLRQGLDDLDRLLGVENDTKETAGPTKVWPVYFYDGTYRSHTLNSVWSTEEGARNEVEHANEYLITKIASGYEAAGTHYWYGPHGTQLRQEGVDPHLPLATFTDDTDDGLTNLSAADLGFDRSA